MCKFAQTGPCRCGEKTMDELLPCPFCSGISAIDKHSNIFQGQKYTNRYPVKVANQDHGYRIICLKCRTSTCWWHYKQEAVDAWSTRQESAEKERARTNKLLDLIKDENDNCVCYSDTIIQEIKDHINA